MNCEFCNRKLYTPGEYRTHLKTMHVDEMAMKIVGKP